jgi:beta-glucosidase
LHFGQVTYQNLTLSDSVITGNQVFTAQVQVTNKGKLPVKETVLWFGHQAYGKITRPVSQLVDFQKIELKPGETKMVRFSAKPEELFTYPDAAGKPIFDFEPSNL